jgi:hypothetical protein
MSEDMAWGFWWGGFAALLIASVVIGEVAHNRVAWVTWFIVAGAWILPVLLRAWLMVLAL